VARVCFEKQLVVGREEPFGKLRASGQQEQLISHLSCGFAVIRSLRFAVICCKRLRKESD
jgi:hypothetical protein